MGENWADKLAEETIWAESMTGESFECVDLSFAKEMLSEIERLRVEMARHAKVCCGEAREPGMRDEIERLRDEVDKKECEIIGLCTHIDANTEFKRIEPQKIGTLGGVPIYADTEITAPGASAEPRK